MSSMCPPEGFLWAFEGATVSLPQVTPENIVI
jgi:hypothetical protein